MLEYTMHKHTLPLLIAASFFTSLPLALANNATPLALGLMLAAQALAIYVITLPPASSRLMGSAWPFTGLMLALAVTQQPGIPTLLLMLSLSFTAFVLRAGHMPWVQLNRFLLVTFTSLAMWPGATGFASPYPAAGLFILTLLMLLSQHRVGAAELTARILLLAAATLAHPVLTVLPALTGLTLMAVWPKRALAVALGGTAFTFALYQAYSAHWWGVIATSTFQTFTTGPEGLAALALLAIVAVQSIYHWRWWAAPQQLAWLLTTLFTILILSQATDATTLALTLPLITHTLLRPSYKA